MGISYYVLGFKPKDEKYDEMKSIYGLCVKHEIDIPEAVYSYFEGHGPDENIEGVCVDKIPFHEFSSNHEEGIIVNLDELPEDVKILKFVIS